MFIQNCIILLLPFLLHLGGTYRAGLEPGNWNNLWHQLKKFNLQNCDQRERSWINTWCFLSCMCKIEVQDTFIKYVYYLLSTVMSSFVRFQLQSLQKLQIWSKKDFWNKSKHVSKSRISCCFQIWWKSFKTIRTQKVKKGLKSAWNSAFYDKHYKHIECCQSLKPFLKSKTLLYIYGKILFSGKSLLDFTWNNLAVNHNLTFFHQCLTLLRSLINYKKFAPVKTAS